MTPAAAWPPMRRVLLPLALLLLLTPLVPAATTAGADPAGDQTTNVVRSDSAEIRLGAPTPCADPATDVVGLAVAEADGLVTLRLELADLAAPALACGDHAFEGTRSYRVTVEAEDGSGVTAWLVEGHHNVASFCNRAVGGARCTFVAAPGFARDAGGLAWTFPLASSAEACGCAGWDLRIGALDARAVTVSHAGEPPAYNGGVPTLAVRDATTPFTVSF